MARTPTGKRLYFQGIRVDKDVWAAMQKLMGRYRTLNEGLRVALLKEKVKEKK